MPRLHSDVKTLCQAAGPPPPVTDSLRFAPGAAAYGLHSTQRRTGPGGGAEARAKLIQRHGAPKACVYPARSLPVCLSPSFPPPGTEMTREHPLTRPHTVTAMRAQMHVQPHTQTPCTRSPAHAALHTQAHGGAASHKTTAVCLGWGTTGAAAGSAGSRHVTSSPENALPFPQPDNYKFQNSKPSEYTIL